jgi:hypothetical protein
MRGCYAGSCISTSENQPSTTRVNKPPADVPLAKLAYRVAPSTLIVEGTNPIKFVYDHFSAEVHKLDEETAVQVADDIASALDRVRGAVGPLPRQASYVIHRST